MGFFKFGNDHISSFMSPYVLTGMASNFVLPAGPSFRLQSDLSMTRKLENLFVNFSLKRVRWHITCLHAVRYAMA